MRKKNWFITFKILILLITLTTVAFSGEGRVPPKDLNLSGSKTIFSSYIYQSAIRGGKGLDNLAKEHSIVEGRDTSFGFAPRSEEARFFIIGSLYSETLAYLRSGNIDLATKRLGAMENEFINLNVPSSLYNYITKTQNILKNEQYPKEIFGEILSLLQLFLEEYAKGRGDDKLTLFRAGSWLFDITLAAAAEDKELLRQGEKLNYFIKEMKRMDAPKGVLDDLDKISKIIGQKEITDNDVKTVLNLVKEIQIILG